MKEKGAINVSELTQQLINIMRNAGKTMLSAHNIENDSIYSKEGSANFVTVYDVKIQDMIIGEIKQLVPDALFIAEEKQNDPSVLMGEHCFIIDPIDGTTNFIHDYRHSCISLAMFSGGEAVFGAVYNPYQNEFFSAKKGKGAFLNDAPMKVSSRPMQDAIVAYGTSPYYKDAMGEKTFALTKELFYRCADVRRCGSAALDLAYTAAGRNDLFFEFLLSPWDIAAGYLLITEAGGVITDMQGNEIDFSKPCPVIAASKNLYGEFLDITKKY